MSAATVRPVITAAVVEGESTRQTLAMRAQVAQVVEEQAASEAETMLVPLARPTLVEVVVAAHGRAQPALAALAALASS